MTNKIFYGIIIVGVIKAGVSLPISANEKVGVSLPLSANEKVGVSLPLSANEKGEP